MHLFKLQYYVFGTGLGIFRLLCNLKSDCFDCVKFGSVCVKTSRPYSDSTFFGCLSKGFWVVSDYFITTSCLVESFSRLSKSREKSEKNILPVLNMTVLNNILLFTLFLLVSYFIANHFNVCFIKKIKKNCDEHVFKAADFLLRYHCEFFNYAQGLYDHVHSDRFRISVLDFGSTNKTCSDVLMNKQS